jgi:multidrug efflux pump subunit AcrA (membrane-fusion protein)
MSTKVEILVDKIDNCLYVPMQAVLPEGDQRVCYVAGGAKPARRELQLGEFNDEFIEVKGGLNEGDRVLLRPPEDAEGSKARQDHKSDDKGKPPHTAPATTPAAMPAAIPAQTKKV